MKQKAWAVLHYKGNMCQIPTSETLWLITEIELLRGSLKRYKLESIPADSVYCPTCETMRAPDELYEARISQICCAECGEAVCREKPLEEA